MGAIMEDRRKSRRIELEAKIMVKRLDAPEPEEIAIEVFDLSKTGIGFKCEKALTIGAVYEAALTIWTKEVIHAFIEIVRIFKDDNSFNYGGVFIGMPEMDMHRIETYETVMEESNK